MKSRKYKRGGKKNITLKWPLSQSSREKLMKEYRGGEVIEFEVYSKESFQAELMEHISGKNMDKFDILIEGMKYEEGVVTSEIIETAIKEGQENGEYFEKLLKLADTKQVILETCRGQENGEGNNSLWIKALTVNNQPAFKALCNIAEIPINFIGSDKKSILRLICEQPQNSKEFLEILLGFKGEFIDDKDKESKLNLLNVGLNGVTYNGYEGGPYDEITGKRIKTYGNDIDHGVDKKHNIKLILTLCLTGLTGDNDWFKLNIEAIDKKYSDYRVRRIELLECLLACSMYGLLDWVKIITGIIKDTINYTVNAQHDDEYAWGHGQYYYNCLHLACINGHVEIVEYLLTLPDINVNAFKKKDPSINSNYINMDGNAQLLQNQNTLRAKIDAQLRALSSWMSTPLTTTERPRVESWTDDYTPLWSVAIIPSKFKTDNHYKIISLLLSRKDINILQSFDIGIVFGLLKEEFTIIEKSMNKAIGKEELKKLLFKYNNKQEGLNTVFNALQWSIFRIKSAYANNFNYENVASILMKVYEKNDIKFKDKDETLEGLYANYFKKTPLYLASENSDVPEGILERLISNIKGNNSSTANERHDQKTIMDNLKKYHSEKTEVHELLKGKGGVSFENLAVTQLSEAATKVGKIPGAAATRVASAGVAAATRVASAGVAATRRATAGVAGAATRALSVVTGAS
jgi:hypothetical protein